MKHFFSCLIFLSLSIPSFAGTTSELSLEREIEDVAPLEQEQVALSSQCFLPKNSETNLQPCIPTAPVVEPCYSTETYCSPSPCCNCFFTAEFIYWKAKEEGLDYLNVVEFPTATPGTFPLTVDFNVRTPDFRWSPGFKVGAGTHFCCNWDLYLRLTSLYSRATNEFSHIGTAVITLPDFFPAFNLPVDPPLLGAPVVQVAADTRWALHFNLVDLLVGRESCLFNCLFVHPFFGLRAAFIHQNIASNYLYTLTVPIIILITREYRYRNNYDAGGLHAGFDAQIPLCGRFTLFGKLAGSLLWGRFSIFQKQRRSANPAFEVGFDPVDVIFKKHHYRTRVNVEGSLGLGWCTCVCNKLLNLNVSYEVSHWFDQNMLIGRLLVGNDPHSDLSFNGFTFGATLFY